MQRRSTLADVARAAGVSKTAVSLVLNDKVHGSVSPGTRQRIVAAARDLGFRPHGVARALSRRRSDVLGVVGEVDPFVHESQHLFEHGLLSAIFRRSLERGYNALVFGYPSDEGSSLSRYADGRSDAMILVNPPIGCALTTYLHRVEAPTVSICFRDPHPHARWVDSDNHAGVRALVNHLVNLGHRRIAYFIGPADEDNAVTRLDAFRTGLAERGLTARDGSIVAFDWETGCEPELRAMVNGPNRPTALLAWNDYAAEQLIDLIRGFGLRVPQDISVCGFDDTPSASRASPPLTTVRQDLVMLGISAVDLAMSALETGDSSNTRSIVCPVHLIARDSTGPAPTG